MLEECARSATQPQLLKVLLQHQTCLGHLETPGGVRPSGTANIVLVGCCCGFLILLILLALHSISPPEHGRLHLDLSVSATLWKNAFQSDGGRRKVFHKPMARHAAQITLHHDI